jgi:thiol-disulfide isomerase/thioredoxin
MKQLIKFLFFLLPITSVLAQEKPTEPLAIGSAAPDFSLPGADGQTYSLKNFKDAAILVVLFTCNHCPTAQAYEDKFIKIVNEYKKSGVAFVAISPNAPEAVSLAELGYSDLSDDLAAMKMRAKVKGYNFPYLYDGASQKTSLQYGAFATPHAFVFDKSRKLRYQGRIDDTENPYVPPRQTDLRNALDALLSGKNVPLATTKTFGCSIKWKSSQEWVARQRAEWKNEPVTLEDIDLQEVGNIIKNDSKNLRLVNVWATWCGPCVMEFPSFVEINRMYRGRNFEFIAISTDKMPMKDKALTQLKKMEASNQNFIFTGEDIYQLIEVVDKKWQGSLPYTALIAPGGEVLYRVEGTIKPTEIKTKIVEYLGRYYADDK